MNSSILGGAPRVLGAAVLFGSFFVAPAAATAAPAGFVGEACTAEEGVTVVVDFTDSGGQVEVACAAGAPENGRDALESAGFTAEDSMPGMICAINSRPDPCPEEFDGNYWSYWLAGDDGEWESYMVGADEAEPAPGAIEGWRYFDGTQGPQVEPAALTGGARSDDGAGSDDGAEAEDQPEADEGEDAEAPQEGAAQEDEAAETDAEAASSSAGIWIGVVAAIAVLGGIIAMLVRRKNQNDQMN